MGGMGVGLTLPVMEPAIAPATLRTWAEAIDAGPFSSLAFGERIAFDNPDLTTLLGAVAAWTTRVPITTTVVVPQLHDPVLLAKALATADRLCGGRLTVGLGVGGREEDYAAVGADWDDRRIADLTRRAQTLQRVWAGENITDATRAVGPPPHRPGGPPLWIGSHGRRTVAAAAPWASGLAGMSLDLDLAATADLFEVARGAWREAGRPAPRLTTSFWFALRETSDDPRAQIHAHLRHYMNWIPTEFVDVLAPTAGFAGTVAELREVLDGFARIGAHEVQLIPTSDDPAQIEALAGLF